MTPSVHSYFLIKGNACSPLAILLNIEKSHLTKPRQNYPPWPRALWQHIFLMIWSLTVLWLTNLFRLFQERGCRLFASFSEQENNWRSQANRWIILTHPLTLANVISAVQQCLSHTIWAIPAKRLKPEGLLRISSALFIVFLFAFFNTFSFIFSCKIFQTLLMYVFKVFRWLLHSWPLHLKSKQTFIDIITIL